MSAISKPAARVGVFAIGLEACWAQSPGLEVYQRHVEEQFGQWATVVSCGLVDTAPEAQAVGRRFAEQRVDLIFCYVETYATSSQVLPAAQGATVPAVVLNLQPAAAPDYENTSTGEWELQTRQYGYRPCLCRKFYGPQQSQATYIGGKGFGKRHRK